MFFCALSDELIEQKPSYTWDIWMVFHQCDVFHAIANGKDEKTVWYRIYNDKAFLMYGYVDVWAMQIWKWKMYGKHHIQNQNSFLYEVSHVFSNCQIEKTVCCKFCTEKVFHQYVLIGVISRNLNVQKIFHTWCICMVFLQYVFFHCVSMHGLKTKHNQKELYFKNWYWFHNNFIQQKQN